MQARVRGEQPVAVADDVPHVGQIRELVGDGRDQIGDEVALRRHVGDLAVDARAGALEHVEAQRRPFVLHVEVRHEAVRVDGAREEVLGREGRLVGRVRQVDLVEVAQAPELPRYRGQVRVPEIDALELLAELDLRRQRRDGVVVEPELLELRELADGRRQLAQLVVAHVEAQEVRQREDVVRQPVEAQHGQVQVLVPERHGVARLQRLEVRPLAHEPHARVARHLELAGARQHRFEAKQR